MDFKEFKMDLGLWLIFGSAFVLLVWTILKILGIINTPFILNAVPYITVVAGFMGIGVVLSKLLIKLGKLLERMDGFGVNLQKMDDSMLEVKVDIRRLERDMGYVKGKLKVSS